MQNYDVIIIGGGLAGLSTAYHLTESNLSVAILEAKDVLGGRTSSWVDDGMAVESGLHRFLGFYKELPELLNNVGIDLDKMLCWEDEIEVILPDGQPSATFGLSPLHKPGKSIAGIIGNNDFLSPIQKLQLARFFAKGLAMLKSEDERLDKLSVINIADEVELDYEIIQRTLVPLTDGVFFMKPSDFSAYVFFKLVANAMKRPHHLRVGAYMGGMTDVMINPIAQYLQNQRVVIETGMEITDIQKVRSSWQIKTANEGAYSCAKLVIATSLKPAQRLTRNYTNEHAYFAKLQKLDTHAALTLQLELDKPSMNIDRTEFGPGTVLSSFAEQSRTTFQQSKGRLSVIFTDPKDHLDSTAEELVEVVKDDCSRLGIELGNILGYRKIAHPHDFYLLAPGMEQYRPEQKAPIEGLYLAGDYTKQDYFATMEGAVISGRLAAEAIDSNKRDQ